jgi:hypothetical protein
MADYQPSFKIRELIMSIDDMIEVLQAVKDGKAEWKYKDQNGWSPFTKNAFESHGIDTPDFRYRVKPEPREWWIVPDQYGGYAFGGIDSARNFNSGFLSKEIVKVREVLE